MGSWRTRWPRGTNRAQRVDGFEQPLPVAQRLNAKLLEVFVRELRQQIQVERVALEGLRILRSPNLLEPLPDGVHAPFPKFDY